MPSLQPKETVASMLTIEGTPTRSPAVEHTAHSPSSQLHSQMPVLDKDMLTGTPPSSQPAVPREGHQPENVCSSAHQLIRLHRAIKDDSTSVSFAHEDKLCQQHFARPVFDIEPVPHCLKTAVVNNLV